MAATDPDTSPDFGDNVDQATFDQILEMDDEEDGDREFSSSIVFDFLQQAETTFKKMEKLIQDKDLDALSGQGHFLKGSSATLGFVHIRDACEKIQNYGHMRNDDGSDIDGEDVALKLIKVNVEDARSAYDKVKILMEQFFGRTAD